MDPLRKSVPNWQNKILQGQHVEDDYYNVKESIVSDIIYSENLKEKGFIKEWKYATGYGLMALKTKLFFHIFRWNDPSQTSIYPWLFLFHKQIL